jgi:RNA polymerase sigma-70 factor (ECF subfamily)
VTDQLGQRSDAALVAGVVQRDTRALGEMYRRHAGAVFALARRLTSDGQAAEDVCQTVFTSVWTSPERFEPERGTVRSWLLAQAHGRAVDHVRSELARRRRHARDAQFAPLAAADVETSVQQAALAEDVRRAIESLPAHEREPVVLAYFGGRSYRAVAELLGQPEGTVKSRIRAGLAHLRRSLDREGVNP